MSLMNAKYRIINHYTESWESHNFNWNARLVLKIKLDFRGSTQFKNLKIDWISKAAKNIRKTFLHSVTINDHHPTRNEIARKEIAYIFHYAWPSNYFYLFQSFTITLFRIETHGHTHKYTNTQLNRFICGILKNISRIINNLVTVI